MSDGAGRVYGIDLGTTYSAIAFIDETARPSVCRNVNNSETTPSVVYFESPSSVVVGESAKQSAYLDADNVVTLIKRRMGSDDRYSYQGRDHTPESISALILRGLAEDAEKHTGVPVERAVITVPAYFGVPEKKATEDAGVIAGFDVVGIVPEPVAAAVHYDLMNDGTEKTVFVFDLGGGTFDTTVIRVGAADITVLCVDGDTNLGGADWDDRLRTHVLEAYVAEAEPEESPEDDPEFMQEVAVKVEDLKKQLSQQESRPVTLRFAGRAVKVEVTRAEFEELTRPLLDRTVEIVRRTLTELDRVAPGTRIDEVLLVGGSTRMPAVAARLGVEFGWSPRLHDPDLAVAKGAAIWGLSRVVFRMQERAREDVIGQGGSAAEADRAASEVVRRVAGESGIATAQLAELTRKRAQGVLPKAFGVGLQDDRDPDRHFVRHLAFANDPLPTGDRPLAAATVRDGQTEVEISVYQQQGTVLSEELEHNVQLTGGSGLITGIPPQPKGAPIDIVLSITEDGLLEVRARERSSGHELTISVVVGMSDADREAASRDTLAISVSS